MHCDHFHIMAPRHKICQDYTTIAQSNEIICAVMSDGCSSANDTDMGARIMAHQFKQKLPRHWGSDYGLACSAGAAADDICRSLGLDQEANYATIGYIFTNGQIIKTALFGDGVVYILDTKGKETIMWVKFLDNTPYYPYYVKDPEINSSYFEGKHGRYSVCSVTEHGVECFAEEVISPNIPTTFMGIYPAQDIKLLAIFSDGIDSFYEEGEAVPILPMVNDFTDFKNFSGEFVQRRCNSVFRDRKNLTWKDDFSIICLTNN